MFPSSLGSGLYHSKIRFFSFLITLTDKTNPQRALAHSISLYISASSQYMRGAFFWFSFRWGGICGAAFACVFLMKILLVVFVTAWCGGAPSSFSPVQRFVGFLKRGTFVLLLKAVPQCPLTSSLDLEASSLALDSGIILPPTALLFSLEKFALPWATRPFSILVLGPFEVASFLLLSWVVGGTAVGRGRQIGGAWPVSPRILSLVNLISSPPL